MFTKINYYCFYDLKLETQFAYLLETLNNLSQEKSIFFQIMLQSDNFCEIILLCLLKFYSNQHLNFFFNLNFFEESLNSKTLKTDIFFKEFFSFFYWNFNKITPFKQFYLNFDEEV